MLKKIMLRFLMALCLASFSFYSFTEEVAPAADVAVTATAEATPAANSNAIIWQRSAELGIVVTSGNSETQTANAKIGVSRARGIWTQQIDLEALNASSEDAVTGNGSTTAEKYVANGKVDYNFNPDNFLFGNANYNDDRFSGFDYQATLSSGYGRALVKTEKQSLRAEIGPGIRFFKVSQDPVTATRFASDDEGILHMAAAYLYTFSEQASFTQDIVVDAGEDVTISESVSAISAKIVGELAMKASIKVRNTSKVPDGSEETDTESALTLVYAF